MSAKSSFDRYAFLSGLNELKPLLESRVQQAKTQRRLPQSSIDDLEAAGVFKLLKPARWGGLEAPLDVFFDTLVSLSRVCPSSAWVSAVLSVHAWHLALFSEEAQHEVWEDPQARICSSYAPTGVLEEVAGGYYLSGCWPYSSGSDYCDWALLGSSGKDSLILLVPKTDIRLEDVWHVSGLQGSGSNNIVVDHAFVPTHRVLKFIDGYNVGSAPGCALNTAPLYRIPFGQIFARAVSAAALGIAEACLAISIDIWKTKGKANDTTKVLCAGVATKLDCLNSQVRHDMNRLMASFDENPNLSLLDRALVRHNAAYMVEQCSQLVNDLFAAHGSGAIFETHPMHRFFQDLLAVKSHLVNRIERPAQNFGSLLLNEANTDLYL